MHLSKDKYNNNRHYEIVENISRIFVQTTADKDIKKKKWKLKVKRSKSKKEMPTELY